MIIFVDGSVTKNPGGLVGYGWYCPDTKEEGHGVAFQGGDASTNSVSEYTAVAAALIHVLGWNLQRPKNILLRSDSELTVNQLNGIWRVKHSNLKPIAALVHMMIEELEKYGVKVSAEWIPREQNKIADSLSHKTVKEALKERRQMTKRELEVDE